MYNIVPLVQLELVQLELVKVHAKLAYINHCTISFLSRTAANLCWHYYALSILNKNLPTSKCLKSIAQYQFSVYLNLMNEMPNTYS